MDEAIYKTKLSICLPKLVQDYQLLTSILTPYHMDDLIFIFEQYDNPLFSASLLNMAAMEDLKSVSFVILHYIVFAENHVVFLSRNFVNVRE